MFRVRKTLVHRNKLGEKKNTSTGRVLEMDMREFIISVREDLFVADSEALTCKCVFITTHDFNKLILIALSEIGEIPV